MTDTHTPNGSAASRAEDLSEERIRAIAMRLDDEGRAQLYWAIAEMREERDGNVARERSDILAKMEETIGAAEHAVSAEERSMTTREEEEERGEMLPHIESSIRRS